MDIILIFMFLYHKLTDIKILNSTLISIFTTINYD